MASFALLILALAIRAASGQWTPTAWSTSTCGFSDGVAAQPATCQTPAVCQYFSASTMVPNFGCCTLGPGFCYMSACFDYNAQGKPRYPWWHRAGAILLDGDALQHTTSGGNTLAAQSYFIYSCVTASNLTPVTIWAETTTASSSTSSLAARFHARSRCRLRNTTVVWIAQSYQASILCMS
ncbi:hypothetical protein MRB53_038148 [Persea americana]|nr:hypothetical protein MRB53_038148 [Persea americana]